MKIKLDNRLFALALLSICLMMFSTCDTKPSDAESARPNIILIFTDELQFSDIACYGGSIPTPEIDKLAAEGLKFTKAYTPASMCTPSRFSVLTGLYPGRCQAGSFLSANPIEQPYNIAWNTWITGELATIPKLLKAGGYITGMAGKWHVGHLPDSVQLSKLDPDSELDDPDLQKELKDRQDIYEAYVKRTGGFDFASSVVWTNFDGHPVKALRFHNFPWITSGAIEFLELQKENDKPFFLYLTPTAIHGPNHVKDLEIDKSFTPEGRNSAVLQYNLDEQELLEKLKDLPGGVKHRYAGISNIDHQLGLIRRKLVEIEALDNTVIIFMSDHNIEPGKATSYEKGIHIPMIVHWPGITQGRESSSLVSAVDVLPTLLDIAEIPIPAQVNLDGESFLPVVKDKHQSTREFVFAENGYTRAITDGRYKYIALRYPDPLIAKMQQNKIGHAPSYVGTWPQAHSAIAMQSFPNYFHQNQLYDLDTDPYEQNNIVADHPELVDKLQDALEDHLGTFTHPFPMDENTYLSSGEFVQHYKVNLEYDLENIPWFRRDHGAFIWPPQ